jgi:hypothetical protein
MGAKARSQESGARSQEPGWRGARFAAVAMAASVLAIGQTSGTSDPVVVQTEHPRLLLRPTRLRLLRRERERNSMRWQQFLTLMAGHAPMAEPGLAAALYYQVADDRPSAEQAIAWALGAGSDLRQQALVFDWCQSVLTETQRRDLIARLEKGMAADLSNDSVATMRSRAFAAIALFDHSPQTPRRELERVVRTWWEGKIAPALVGGGDVARDDVYPLMELMHAVRDSTSLDLRDAARQFFKDLPIEHLLSYYPAAYPAPENDYYIGAAATASQEPDLRHATLSRAADMAMVAYDNNALESQMLQGWVMHDRFQLKSTFGTPYEFLWANPYQPGLSYYHAPLGWHSAESGTLYVRSSWEDTASWFGSFNGVMQVFADGHLSMVDPARPLPPLLLEQAAVCFAKTTRRFRVTTEGGVLYVVGLEPRHTYQVEVDDEEMFETESDRGGILALEIPAGRETGLRLK